MYRNFSTASQYWHERRPLNFVNLWRFSAKHRRLNATSMSTRAKTSLLYLMESSKLKAHQYSCSGHSFSVAIIVLHTKRKSLDYLFDWLIATMKQGSTTYLDTIPETMEVEIVLDNAKSHAGALNMKKASSSPKDSSSSKRITRRSRKIKEDEDQKVLDLGDLRAKDIPVDHCFHSSFPGRDVALGVNHHKDLCRWASSSASNFSCVPIAAHLSFDGMLKEVSSAKDSALTNVTRPMRRSSLKSSPFQCDADEKVVLHSICSNLMAIEIDSLSMSIKESPAFSAWNGGRWSGSKRYLYSAIHDAILCAPVNPCAFCTQSFFADPLHNTYYSRSSFIWNFTFWKSVPLATQRIRKPS